MISAEKVIVAIDTQDESRVKTLLNQLGGHKVWVKIGMEVFYALGPSVIHLAKDAGFKVFLDLKLHDIPNTVAQGLKSLSALPVDMLNVHAAGGSEMLKAAAEALKSMPNSPLLIAVTQLTSTSQAQMNQDQKIPGKLEDSVLNYATLARNAGLDGVVSSPLEVQLIKKHLGQEFLTVTPGIRLKDHATDDQKRITTPLEALELGTDYMVIGRPITAQPDPKAALEKILQGKNS